MVSVRPHDADVVSVGSYACLSFEFDVTASTTESAAAFAHLYASCEAPLEVSGDTRRRVELLERAGRHSVCLGGDEEVEARDEVDLLLAAMTEIDHATVQSSADDFLLLHASAYLVADGPVVLVGSSGAGKSTLAAAMTATGHAYVGDEIIGVDAATAHLLANPKPLKLDRRARAALRNFIGTDRVAAHAAEEERLVAPLDLGPVAARARMGAPLAIVQVEFRAGAEPALTPMSRADVAVALADQCFNFARWGARALDTVVDVARRATGARLVFGELDGARAALHRITR